ncbi:MAG TPA: hypothetical protein VFF73_02420 [Planctomycetota bacterium]|nr:hypothetical protein [Planctomycetota bacterium]
MEQNDLDLALTREDYASRREGWERELLDLTRRIRVGKVPVVIVFEGAQGAGMGRAIFDLTEKMDPRAYVVRPIAPERGFERSRPWLWRFWMATPARGEISIFDESWYLRVLGDRANGDVKKSEWRAAYHEIEAFERNLIDDGTILVKLFFTIDRKTAKRRYLRAKRVGAPHLARRRRNLARFPKWQKAADEMLERTSTDRAPWHVIPAKNERFARGRMFEILIEALKRGLDERHVPQVQPPPKVEAPLKTDGAAAPAPARS